MTTGNTTSGSKTSVSTTAGPGFKCVDYRTRVWSGSDRAKIPYKYEIIDTSHTVSYIKVFKGKKTVVIKYRKRFLKRKVRPPRSLVMDVPHNYTCTRTLLQDDVFSYYYPNPVSGTCTGMNSGNGNAYSTFLWDSNDDIAILGKLREKIAGSDFNAGVTLGESKEALKMIADSATRISKAYVLARKGKLRRASRVLVNGTDRSGLGRKTVANNWLELQYGWLPLLADADAAARFLAQQLEFPLQQRFLARSSKKMGTVRPSSDTNAKFTKSVIYTRKQIVATLKEKDVVKLSGLTDPLSIAWELMPYSFVIDWFLPIGNYLSARGLAQSLTGTFVTTRKDYFLVNGISPGRAGVVFGKAASSYKQEYCKIDRTVSTTLSVPLPRVKQLSEVVSWKRAANAVALLSQLK